jgi:hypothetical protein
MGGGRVIVEAERPIVDMPLLKSRPLLTAVGSLVPGLALLVSAVPRRRGALLLFGDIVVESNLAVRSASFPLFLVLPFSSVDKAGNSSSEACTSTGFCLATRVIATQSSCITRSRKKNIPKSALVHLFLRKLQWHGKV